MYFMLSKQTLKKKNYVTNPKTASSDSFQCKQQKTVYTELPNTHSSELISIRKTLHIPLARFAEIDVLGRRNVTTN